ncbi:hypothetical protein EG347_05715 [Chryseobacterium sp. G0186]|uniref:hypothetical protein n=1 Tax=Chryseobacterium sp. G0186 TaxID=2487064 RepID=UPI000F4E94D8|nr:hypothetical protein [Chryseobacterium sp. G0186]AZA77040.1 hypothetical protein EG347_05715 [Chryseobacterium sp. G0186]
MIPRVFIILFSLFFTFSFAQKKKKARDLLAEIHQYPHGGINKDFKPVPLQKRLTRFPFDKAVKVKIISYNLNFIGSAVPYLPKPPVHIQSDSISLKKYYENFKKPVALENLIKDINHKDIQESKTLTLTEISELSDVLYNTCKKYYIAYTSKNGCFFPRNAILFYDEDDNVFAYFEICFECLGIESFPKEMMDPIETCEFLYPDLKKFFKSKGLTTEYVSKK